MKTVNVHKAKTELSKLLADVEAGEEVVIARRGKPVARMVAIEPPAPQSLEPRKPEALTHLREAGWEAATEIDWFEHAPDDYISKEDIAAYYRKYPEEWNEMRQRVGFAEGEQAEFDLTGLREAVEAGRGYTIMEDGKPVANVVPVGGNEPRKPGRFAHLRGNLPPDLFAQSLTDDELAGWEGDYSASADR